MYRSMPPIPHTYAEDVPIALIKEYARRYKVLWAVKNGLPFNPKLNKYNYMTSLGLLDIDTDGKLVVTPKAEITYFTSQSFGETKYAV